MSKDLTDAECTDGEILRRLRMTINGRDDYGSSLTFTSPTRPIVLPSPDYLKK